mgnify:FL=1
MNWEWPSLHWLFLNFNSSECCHSSECTLKWFDWLFDALLRRTSKILCLSNKFKVWVSYVQPQHFATLLSILLFFSFAKLTENRIYNHWKYFLCGEEHRKWKICQFPAFIDKIQCLLNRISFLSRQHVKNIKYQIGSSNPSLNYWTYFPKECWVIFKQDKMLNFL